MRAHDLYLVFPSARCNAIYVTFSLSLFFALSLSLSLVFFVNNIDRRLYLLYDTPQPENIKRSLHLEETCFRSTNFNIAHPTHLICLIRGIIYLSSHSLHFAIFFLFISRSLSLSLCTSYGHGATF